MTTYASLLAAGLDVCERAGYRTERPEKGWLPDAIATVPEESAVDDGTDSTADETDKGATLDPLFGDRSSPLAIEPLDVSDVEPTTVISRLWNNSTNGRRSLFVVPGGDADALATTVAGLLSNPSCVASEDDDGCRVFYNSPDRIALAGGGYALHKSTDADFRWFEEVNEGWQRAAQNDSEQPEGSMEATDSMASARTGSDGKRLVLADGDEEVAVFDGVDGLGCPPASSFPYSYRRNPRDKCFHVTDASGREVGVFTDMRSVRAAAYEPIPMPFVPEHLFDASVRSLWGVLAVGDDESWLYTAEGRERITIR